MVVVIWLKYTKAWLIYEGTSTVNNKNYKTQVHARVCEENKLEELEKNYAY